MCFEQSDGRLVGQGKGEGVGKGEEKGEEGLSGSNFGLSVMLLVSRCRACRDIANRGASGILGRVSFLSLLPLPRRGRRQSSLSRTAAYLLFSPTDYPTSCRPPPTRTSTPSIPRCDLPKPLDDPLFLPFLDPPNYPTFTVRAYDGSG
jgi:hypothetical protein